VPVRGWNVPGFGSIGGEDEREIMEDVRTAAYKIIQGKGATNYAVGLAVATILQAIMWDEKRVLSVSSLAENYFGVGEVCISWPSIVDRLGVRVKLPVPLEPVEEGGLRRSALTIRHALETLGF
jgi:L-lactate dehydrogenase